MGSLSFELLRFGECMHHALRHCTGMSIDHCAACATLAWQEQMGADTFELWSELQLELQHAVAAATLIRTDQLTGSSSSADRSRRQ